MASFGETLRRERELRGVDLREVADATKISVRFLQALESDRIEVLPGGIFPRAFVRQYATYLGLDPDRMVAEFVYAHGDHPGGAAGPAAAPRRDGRPVRVSLIVAILIVAALGLAAWAALRWEGRGAAAEPSPVAAIPSTTFPPDPVYPPPTTAAVPTEAQRLVLALSSHQSCWVAVQADGVKVMDRIMNQGETQTLTARNEMVLSVGNAGGLTFTLNGRPGVPLGREGEVRRNIVITRQSLPSLVQQSPPPPSPAG